MTRKDYELLASTLNAVHRFFAQANQSALMPYNRELATVQTTASQLANRLQADNPRFDRDRFMRAVLSED